MDTRCAKCQKTFQSPAHLRRHMSRKTPCELAVETESPGAEKKENQCPHCGRQLGSYSSYRRHVREYCKLAPSGKPENLANQVAALRAQNEQILHLLSGGSPFFPGPGCS